MSNSPATTSPAKPGEVRRALIAVIIARVGINGALRVVFPFLPAIARGLGTTLERVADLTALTAIVGITGPLASRAAERFGRRSVMFLGLAAALVGSVTIGLAPTVSVAAVGFLLVGFGKPWFDVPMQGWFGSRVPYERRGRVLGLTELTWAGGLLATVPLSGFLISRYGWRVQFAVVAVLLVIGLFAVGGLMADDRPKVRQRSTLALTRPRAMMLLVVFLFSFAAQGTFVVYGAWLETDLGLDVAGIGVFTLVVVAAELTGEGLIAGIGDRVGLRRAVVTALVVSAVAYVGLGLVGDSLSLAVAVVVVWFVSYEITIVGTIPFMTALGGEGRDRLLGLMTAAVALARAGSALVMPGLFESGGIRSVGLLAAGCVVIGSGLLLTAVPDPTSGSQPLSPDSPSPSRAVRPPDAEPLPRTD